MRYNVLKLNCVEDDGVVKNDVICVEDTYFDFILRMDKIGDVNELVESLNIANKVLGNEFEAEYDMG